MIYLDTSVALATLFTEKRAPPRSLWAQPLVSSRLFQFEIMNRVYSRGLGPALVADAIALVDGVTLFDLTNENMARALKPFPVNVGTLDGLHLATMDFLRDHGQTITLASYDKRMLAAAKAMNFELLDL
jgi:predicted nucleic acid-binding protein